MKKMLKKLYWKAWRIFVVHEILGDTVHIVVKDLAKDVRIIKNKKKTLKYWNNKKSENLFRVNLSCRMSLIKYVFVLYIQKYFKYSTKCL